MIPIHLVIHLFVQSASANASGCTVRRVTCEHCRLAYIYQLRRTATGIAQSYLFMGGQHKKVAAEAAAHANLQKRLTKDHDAVPCPAWGQLQQQMIREVRKKRLKFVSLVSFFLAVIVGMCWLSMDPWLVGRKAVPYAQGSTAILIVWTLVAAAWAFLQNPNAAAHRRTRELGGQAVVPCRRTNLTRCSLVKTKRSADLAAFF